MKPYGQRLIVSLKETRLILIWRWLCFIGDPAPWMSGNCSCFSWCFISDIAGIVRFLSCIYVVDDDRSQSPINVSSPVSSSLHRPITQQSAFSKPHPSATDVSHTPTAHSPKRQRCESPERPCEPVSPLRLAEGGYRDVPTLNRHTQENNVDSRLSPTPSTEGCDVKKSSPSPPVHVSSTHIKITNTGMVNNVDSRLLWF